MSKKILALSIVLVLIVLGLFLLPKDPSVQSDASQQSSLTNFVVNTASTAHTTTRVGVNLGYRSSYGSEQLMKNIIPNPGFEGLIDRIIVIVNKSDDTGFSDDKGWGYPDGHWDGARFEVRTGPSTGMTGTIQHSLMRGDDGLPHYITAENSPKLGMHDVISLTNPIKPGLDLWTPASSQSLVNPDPSRSRPGSSGVQSVKLSPNPNDSAEFAFYFDGMDPSIGNLLLVNGTWELSFWMMSDSDEGNVEVSFARMNGAPAFFNETIPTTRRWEKYTYHFAGNESEASPFGYLKLDFKASGNQISVWIDDAYLGPIQKNKLAFRQEVVDLLKKMRPSFIRDAQGQLGDAMPNRIADPYARRPHASYVAKEALSHAYSYSLTELLDLCSAVGANPWIIIPPVLTDAELEQLGLYLSENAPKTRFSSVILEFGNENWNWNNRSAGIPYPDAHNPAANSAFLRITNAAGSKVNIRRTVNGRYGDPESAIEFIKNVPLADTLAIAPYFYFSQDTGTDPDTNVQKMFQHEAAPLQNMHQQLKGMHKKFAVSEVNLSAVQGTATMAERDPIVNGAASGAALANQIIQNLYANAHPVMVYALSPYWVSAWDIQDHVKLFGIARDLSPTLRIRPTGLAVMMLNKVIGGSLHAISPDENSADQSQELAANFTLAGFETASAWNAAVVSKNRTPQQVSIQFPDDGRRIPNTLWVLASKTPFDTNEEGNNVKITVQPVTVNPKDPHKIQFTIPAYGFGVLNYVADNTR